jgi:secreted trypsin-like serine protease
MIVRILLVVAVFGLIAKTTQGDATGNQFIGGPGSSSPVTAAMYPSFVSITSGAVLCGGFIVNVNHVVTAGSCVLNIDTRHLVAPGIVQIRFNTVAPGGGNQLGINRIYLHPLFNPVTFDNDIAVLRTVTNLPIQEGFNPHVFAAEINDRIVQDGMVCTFVGLTGGANGPTHFILQPVMNRVTCNEHYSNRVVPSQFCAGTTEPNGPCILNRGGPLFCNDRVSGILSHGFSCGVTPNMPGVYTQIRMYIPWILQQFNRTDLTPGGSTPAPTFPLLSGQSTIVGYASLISLCVLGLILAR